MSGISERWKKGKKKRLSWDPEELIPSCCLLSSPSKEVIQTLCFFIHKKREMITILWIILRNVKRDIKELSQRDSE